MSVISSPSLHPLLNTEWNLGPRRNRRRRRGGLAFACQEKCLPLGNLESSWHWCFSLYVKGRLCWVQRFGETILTNLCEKLIFRRATGIFHAHISWLMQTPSSLPVVVDLWILRALNMCEGLYLSSERENCWLVLTSSRKRETSSRCSRAVQVTA